MNVTRKQKFLWRYAKYFGAMLIGIPDYDAYIMHMAVMHPELKAMSKTDFIRSRMNSRFEGKGGGKCPC